jgi:hypothetical protein
MTVNVNDRLKGKSVNETQTQTPTPPPKKKREGGPNREEVDECRPPHSSIRGQQSCWNNVSALQLWSLELSLQ